MLSRIRFKKFNYKGEEVKALEILKRIYINKPDTRYQRNNIDINFTIHDFFNVNEAIKELEALENRSCDNCINLSVNTTGFCMYYGICNGDFEEDMKNVFYCNKWESKC